MGDKRTRRRPIESKVPCGECSLCCRGDLIVLHREFGDKTSNYHVQRIGKVWALQHQENGDCIYLDRAKGCTIHARRPAICREFDCRGVVLRARESALMRKYASADVLARGKELLGMKEVE